MTMQDRDKSILEHVVEYCDQIDAAIQHFVETDIPVLRAHCIVEINR